MKRYFALLLSVLMVLGTTGAVSALELPLPTETLPETRSILNFADDKTLRDAFGMGELKDDDGETVIAGRMNPSSGREYPQWDQRYYFDDTDIDQDMSGYRTINFRMYSETATNATFAAILLQSQTWSDGYLITKITVDWTGWKTFSLDFADFDTSKSGIGPNKVDGFIFAFSGYNTTFVGGTDVSISEIYLSNPVEGALKLEDSKIISTFDTAEKIQSIVIASWGNKKIQADSDIKNLYDMTAKYTVTDTSDSSMNLPECSFDAEAEQYQYFNMLVHSNKATAAENSGFNVLLFASTGYFRTTFPVDWVDWKVVSIPLSQFSTSNGATWNQITSVRINSGGWGYPTPELGTEVNFDLVWFSKESPVGMSLKETSLPNGAIDLPAEEAEVSFQFNNPIRLVDEASFAGALTKTDGTNGQPVTCTAEGKTLTLTTQGTLDYETGYKLTIPAGAVTDIFGQSNEEDITYSFTTQEQGLNAAMPILTDRGGNPLSAMPANGETIKASVRVSNGLSEGKAATLILVCYDKDNRMVDYKIVSKTVPANGIDTLELETTAAGVMAKAFLWDDFTSLHPLYNGFAQVPAPESNGGMQGTDTENPSLTLNSTELKEEQLFIAGRVDGALPRMAIIAVKGETQEEPLFLSPVMAEDGGTFSVETVIPEGVASGAYEVSVTARRIDGKQTALVHYINRKERDTLVDAVNAAEAQKDVTKQLEYYRIPLGLPESNVLFAHIAQTVFEQKPYADYASFTAMQEQAQTVLATLNAATWAEYSKLIAENPMILNGHADEAYYINHSVTGKAEVNRKVVLSAPFDSFASFRTAFARAIADYKRSSESSGSSGGGTGGGGSGGKSILNGGVSMPAEMVHKETEGETSEPSQPEKRFIDLADAEWARESVEQLCAAGAIAPAEWFRPNDDITREEFVKLIVEVFGVGKSTATVEFTDADTDAWYVPYLATAQSMGIVTGYEDGRFGIGEQITRQDMAVMLNRALEGIGVTLTSESEKAFADDGEISSYARSAVYAMKEAGVINGVGSGCFAPTQNASRAEAAKMLCGMRNLLKK